MLTYESLRKIVTEERSKNTFMSLPDDFFSQAAAYLKDKEKVGTDKWELESAKRMLQDLLEAREKKILMASLYFSRVGTVPEGMTAGEKGFFDKIVASLKEFQKGRGSLAGPAAEGKTVELLQDVPEFVAPDMKTYGPSKKGEAATLPAEVAELLVKKGLAKVR